MATERASDLAVTVVVPILNGAATLAECLDALAAQSLDRPWELVVVDNGSTDGTPDLVARHPVGARVLHESTRGPYAARNTGIRGAKAPVVALTDIDCVPDAHWLRAGLDAIDAGADLVGGQIVQRASASPTIWERYDRATYLRQDEFIERERFAATANLFVRAEVFEKVGVFKPQLVASGDLEFGQRATNAGFTLAYSEPARVLHHPRTTLRDTWALHRKLGSGFAELAHDGLRGKARDDLALRVSLQSVWEQVAADGGAIRRRQLAPVHALVLAARWAGRLTGRG